MAQSDRRSFIGGSDARTIMGDDDAALLRLWREKRGEVEPEDLTANLIVQLGVVTEHLNRHWYERNTGQVVTEVQRRWMAATLEGIVEATGAVFEATPVLFDELDADQLKRPSEHSDRLNIRPHAKPVILSFFLRRIGSSAVDYFRGSRRFGRCGGFCGSHGSGPSKADARLIAICEFDTGCLQRRSKRRLISGSDWDSALDHFYPTNSGHTDFRGFG
jgi:YqaJ-like viral recombinase domain